MQIYIHGLGQRPDSWQKAVSYLNTGEEHMCPDLAKLVCGKKATYDNLYAAFSAICDAVEGPLRLCGLSLGGVLALHYAAEHPGRVAALVLISAQYQMPEKLLRVQNAVFRLMPSSMFQQMGFQKEDVLSLCQTMAKLDISTSIHKISCPCMVVCGGRDHANKRASAKLAGMLKNAEFHVLNGVGHEVNVEAPEELAELLFAFYNKNAN